MSGPNGHAVLMWPKVTRPFWRRAPAEPNKGAPMTGHVNALRGRMNTQVSGSVYDKVACEEEATIGVCFHRSVRLAKRGTSSLWHRRGSLLLHFLEFSGDFNALLCCGF